MSDVTRILTAIEQGDTNATEKLLPLVYQELRCLAAQKMFQEQPGQTLQGTALVHEAYIRLVGSEAQQWGNRSHFFAAAAEAMRRILVENARRKKSFKHGGQLQKVSLDGLAAGAKENSDHLIALDEALDKLAAEDPTKAELVKLRYFAGLNIDQAAQMLGISRATAIRYWSFAKAWLFHAIRKDS
jgi:RNA polymerase sigma factor (TIGR02999 family)